MSAVDVGEDTLRLAGEWTLDGTPEDVARTLADVRRAVAALKEFDGFLTDRLAEALDYGHPLDVDGVGRVEVKRGRKRSRWQGDDLLRAVLDSRRADEDGEPIDESPLEKVLHVWNLGAPRVTALKERRLQADEFCESVPGTVSVVIT